MKIAIGDMWSAYERADLFLITTNGVLDSQQNLVMGRGIAREARERIPALPKLFGQEILRLGNGCFLKERGAFEYGFLQHENWPDLKIGLFQVKYRWFENADPTLIQFSVRSLNMYLRLHPQLQVHLNYPGIGNGHLDTNVVSPIIHQLTDQVTVWKYDARYIHRKANTEGYT